MTELSWEWSIFPPGPCSVLSLTRHPIDTHWERDRTVSWCRQGWRRTTFKPPNRHHTIIKVPNRHQTIIKAPRKHHTHILVPIIYHIITEVPIWGNAPLLGCQTDIILLFRCQEGIAPLKWCPTDTLHRHEDAKKALQRYEGVKQTFYQYEDAKQASCQYYGAASSASASEGLKVSASGIAPRGGTHALLTGQTCIDDWPDMHCWLARQAKGTS